MLKFNARGTKEELMALYNLLNESEKVLGVKTGRVGVANAKDRSRSQMSFEVWVKPETYFEPAQKPRKPAKQTVHGFVYVFRCSAKVIKIGASESPLNRQKQFKSNLPFEAIHIIHTIETDDVYGLEAALHEEFKKWRYQDTREYFDLPDEQLEILLSRRGM